jgi:hypothetical protein
VPSLQSATTRRPRLNELLARSRIVDGDGFSIGSFLWVVRGLGAVRCAPPLPLSFSEEP